MGVLRKKKFRKISEFVTYFYYVSEYKKKIQYILGFNLQLCPPILGVYK